MTRTDPFLDPFLAVASAPVCPLAAVIGGEAARSVVAHFAQTLHARGFSVAGVTQRTSRDAFGRKSDMALVDVISGQSISVSQHLGQGSQSCSLDEQAVCAVSGRLLTEVHQHPALLVLSKFGHLEAQGRGFRGDFAAAALVRVPTLTTVAPDSVADWIAFTGGQGVILPADPVALWRWWGARHVLADLARSVPTDAGALITAIRGRHWLMVNGSTGWGLAPVPGDDTPKDHDTDHALPTKGTPLAVLAGGVTASCRWRAAWALAALNAYHGSFAHGQVIGADRALVPFAAIGEDDTFLPVGGRQGLIQALWAVPQADRVYLNAGGVIDQSLPLLLEACAEGADITLGGIAAPFCERVFSYGISALVGASVRDPDGCAQAITAGAKNEDDLLPYLTLRRWSAGEGLASHQ